MNESKVSGRISLDFSKEDKVEDKIKEFTDKVYEQFKEEGKRVETLVTENIDTNIAVGKIIFDYIVRVYDYDYASTEAFWKRYSKIIGVDNFELIVASKQLD